MKSHESDKVQPTPHYLFLVHECCILPFQAAHRARDGFRPGLDVLLHQPHHLRRHEPAVQAGVRAALLRAQGEGEQLELQHRPLRLQPLQDPHVRGVRLQPHLERKQRALRAEQREEQEERREQNLITQDSPLKVF
ncbi:hypothetical protein AVEN_56359-1 [Araneus ventricosus]|uniref:Uncharacterized protein n=1 Tax=Araneus ventricosus TaxID=182803 RepID=A0A4Y2LMS5_ARAVE|nr:hypothetical protein AVEN_56359-1 [Araneus ventricosus]